MGMIVANCHGSGYVATYVQLLENCICNLPHQSVALSL